MPPNDLVIVNMCTTVQLFRIPESEKGNKNIIESSLKTRRFAVLVTN